MRAKIAALNLRIEEMDDDTSCAALNRLRGKLRELMKGGQKTDHEVSSVMEKSIETMMELSKSCSDLKSENENLLAQLEALQRKLGPDGGNFAECHEKLEKFEALVADLKKELIDKSQVVGDLENVNYNQRRISEQLEIDLDKITVSRNALMNEFDALKSELIQKDAKVSFFSKKKKNNFFPPKYYSKSFFFLFLIYFFFSR